jgi:hypothetical protein
VGPEMVGPQCTIDKKKCRKLKSKTKILKIYEVNIFIPPKQYIFNRFLHTVKIIYMGLGFL